MLIHHVPNGYWTGQSQEVNERDAIPVGWIEAPTPPELPEGKAAMWADGWVITDPPQPAQVIAQPIQISRLDFRRLLTPVEAARFRLLEAAPRLTVDELEQAFDPSSPNPELQIRVAVEDAIQQWNLLDQGVIELDHSDTQEFLEVMGLAGMFGENAATRIPQILAQEIPT